MADKMFEQKKTVTVTDVEKLVDAARERLQKEHPGRRFSDYDIFYAVFGESKDTDEVVYAFIKNTGSCPPEVVEYCQKILAPTIAA